MKKKYILLSISLILVIGLIANIINKNSKEYIMQDGVMLAFTLDGEKIDSYPSGTKYSVKVSCKNGKGKWLVDEWKLAVEEVTSNIVCNIDFISNPTLLKTEVEAKATTNANGYRYSGKQPNNYVWFNNEMWRIIGSIPTCLSASCGTNTTNLVKIIRDQSIGSSIFGTSGVWGNSILKTLLNNYYYGKSDGTNTGYCYNYETTRKAVCDYRAIGISGLNTDYYGKMIKNVYWNTGATINSYTVEESYDKEIANRKQQNYIGLFSLSDYGYATDSKYYSTILSNYSLEAVSYNWLNIGCPTINQTEGNSGSIQYISSAGSVSNGSSDSSGHAIYPVVYLDPSVYIISGDGTEGNPYQIGM